MFIRNKVTERRNRGEARTEELPQGAGRGWVPEGRRVETWLVAGRNAVQAFVDLVVRR